MKLTNKTYSMAAVPFREIVIKGTEVIAISDAIIATLERNHLFNVTVRVIAVIIASSNEGSRILKFDNPKKLTLAFCSR